MDCGRFQEQITDYLDGALEARARAECAAHRLRCRECREIYNDVRATVAALSKLDQMPAPTTLEERILSATTAGVMLNCFEFDRLLERYFDGVILAPTFQTFQAHFEHCPKCSRLLGSIEDAIALCREVKETEVEVPESLCDRIVAATSGRPAPLSWRVRLSRRGDWLGQRLRLFWTPQWAAAALIFITSCTFVGLRFGGMSGLASQAGAQADRIMTEGHVAINETGVLAITGLQRVSNGVTSLWREARRAKTPNRGRTQTPGTQNSSPSPSRGVKPLPASGQRGPGEGIQNP
jgi:anti-sigma factor RsiW